MVDRRTFFLIGAHVALTAACGASDAGQTPASPSPSTAVPAGWHMYSDAMHRFQISYPDEYGIVPENQAVTNGALVRVRFQDKQLLATPLAELEPPRFSIEVFPAPQTGSLETWLRTVNRLPAGAAVTRVALEGAREGLRVRQPQQLAPNEFYYFSTAVYVYALTPLGSNADTMLGSFRLS